MFAIKRHTFRFKGRKAAGLLLFAVFALAAVASLSLRPASADGRITTVIVQLQGEPVVVARHRAETEGRDFDAQAYRRQVVAEQDAFLSRVSAAGIAYTVAGVSAPNGEVTADIQFRFNYVYNGVTLVVPEAAIPALKGIEGVANVHPADEVGVALDRAVGYVRAPALYGSPPRLGQFDELSRPGLHGEGMIVAVIDTGVDWSHPMFGGDPTPPQFGVGPATANRNQKVIYYLNLTAGATGDDYGHGTHVAADIAGFQGQALAPSQDGVPYAGGNAAVHGVAPQARIMAYKSLSGVGVGLNPSTIMAIEDAVQPFTLTGLPKPVPHVINLSLSSAAPAGNNPDHPTAVACDNATLAGITVVAAASNEGRPGAVTPDGEATIGSPGAGRRVLTVGASNDPGSGVRHIALDRALDAGESPDLTDVLDPAGLNRAQSGLVDGTNKAVAPGRRTNINVRLAGGSPYLGSPVAQYYVFAGTIQTAADVPDSVAGRIAVARVSGAYGGVAAALAAKGASAAMLVTPDATGKVTIAHSNILVWTIKETEANYLLDLLSSNDNDAGDPAKGALSEFPVRVKPGVYQPAMGAFSSKGPVGGFGQVKPDVTAPGVNILSATVRVGGAGPSGAMFDPTGYISASGTSFASPITAGAVALIKQKHLDWTPSMIRAALINTATNLRHADGTPLADGVNSLNEQGGGLIDVAAAANAKALMGTGAPGPTGSTPGARPFQIGVSPLVGTSPGNPDFSASYSFANVAVSGVIGTSTHTQTVNIHYISGGGGAGTYSLSAGNVRFVDGTRFQVSFTDEAGNAISSVTVPAKGSARFKVNLVVDGETAANPTQVQWYVTAARTDGGQRLRMPFYFRAVAPTVAAAAPSFTGVGGNELSGNPPVDINGAYQLQFAKPAAGAQASKLRVQESSDGGATWATLADVDAAQTTFDVAGKGNGTYQYRVVALYPVQHGLFAGPASAARTVRVDRRLEADVSSMVELVNQSIVFGAGFTELTSALRNKSAGTTVYAPAKFVITSVSSWSGLVRVSNADNAGDGRTSAASFDYSNQLPGGDLTPGESSGTRVLRFSNPNTELFTFSAVVRAHLPDPAFAPGGSAAGAASSSVTTGGEAGGDSTVEQGTSEGGVLGAARATLKFTVNPLTRTVSLAQ